MTITIYGDAAERKKSRHCKQSDPISVKCLRSSRLAATIALIQLLAFIIQFAFYENSKTKARGAELIIGRNIKSLLLLLLAKSLDTPLVYERLFPFNCTASASN